jgi:L-alanine-DL-glutamate epimerase-like enolase superfamily enzyme
MKITALDVVRVDVPLSRPYIISRGPTYTFQNVLARLQGEDGLVGLGECSALSVVGDPDRAAARLRQEIGPRVIGLDSLDVETILERIGAASWPGDRGPIAALDNALWDLNGKALGLPAYKLLGGLLHRRMPVDYTLGEDSPEAMGRRAVEMAEVGGFRAFCVKVGGGSLELDVARFKAVRQAVGPAARIRADANAGYDAASAIAFLRAVESDGLEFLEQPLPRGDFEGLKQVYAATRAPLSVDEGLWTVQDAYALAETGAVTVFNIKIPKCGGLYLSRKIAAVAEAAGIACICGGALALEVTRQASRHFVAGTQLGAHDHPHEGPGPASQALTGNVTRRVLDYEDVCRWGGYVEIDDAPGLGLEEDLESVQRFTVG